MEIRNQLTLELITTLQSTEAAPRLTGPLAYSPDGRSIACASDTAIIIWDIQTGGVAKEIECSPNNISLVWSSDGQTICTIGTKGQVAVHTYDISPGTISSPGALHSEDDPHLWTDKESFWVMTTVRGRYPRRTIDIFKLGSTLTKIRSFAFSPSGYSEFEISSFSPTTRHISILDGHTLRIFDIQNSKCLLDTTGRFLSHCFSADGIFFAASQESGVHIWKYAFGRYLPSTEFQCQGWSTSPLRFSPTPSSILGHSGNILQVLRIHEPPTSLKTRRQQCVGLSCSGTHVATAYKLGHTIQITNLLAQTPPQFIDTSMVIEGLVLTGNVLLVVDFARLTAWLLTGEGLVDGFPGDRPVGRSDSIWTIPRKMPCGDSWTFSVEGQVGVIKRDANSLYIYHTETGEVFHPTQAPRHYSDNWYHLGEALCGRHYLRCHNLLQCDIPPEDSWQNSRAALREGWVKDPEGKHRLWVPVEWRTDWDPTDWRHDATTQFSLLEGVPVLIKF